MIADENSGATRCPTGHAEPIDGCGTQKAVLGMQIRRGLGIGLVAATLLLGAACSNDDSGDGDSNDSGTGDKGKISLSGQNFGEMQIMAAMYEQVLENAGYQVDVKLVDTRDVYEPQLETGAVDVAPDYLAGMADILNKKANGVNAPSITKNSAEETLDALRPLAEAAGITMLDPADATDQNAFAVTKEFAEENDLKTLSDLAALDQPITLAAAPDCESRPDCEGGLTNVYGLDIVKILPTGFDSAETKDSVTQGESQLGLVATTDGALDQENLVILEDDQGIQPAQNLIPAVNSDFLKDNPDVATILNELSGTLTTDDLASLDVKVDVNREQPGDVAQEYLESKGLLD
jgi:osmoprotectant transport system substrate-binding protein